LLLITKLLVDCYDELKHFLDLTFQALCHESYVVEIMSIMDKWNWGRKKKCKHALQQLYAQITPSPEIIAATIPGASPSFTTLLLRC